MLETAQFGKIGNWRTSLDAIRKSPGNGAESLYFYEWAERPVILSEAYFTENLPESSSFTDGPALIQDIMRGVDSMFLHEFNDFNHEYLSSDGFRPHLLARLKDPGVLHHFIFWDFIKDPTAVAFEWHHFKGHSKLCISMLCGQNYDIYGRPRAHAAVGPWKCLIDLYNAYTDHSHDDEYGQKLFREVLAWPLP